MNQLAHLLRWDFVHLQRYQMISVSLLVGAVYLGVFYLLKSLGDLENLLVVMIFNDPVIMSYLFAGVLWLSERNQGTAEALSVAPRSQGAYLGSRAISLSVVATFVAVLMVWVGYGFRIAYLPFVVGTFGTSVLFVWLGCVIAHRSDGFNAYLIRSVAFFILAGLPLLALFEVWDTPLLYLIPSFPGMLLLQASFEPLADWQYFYSYLYLFVATATAFWWCQRNLRTL